MNLWELITIALIYILWGSKSIASWISEQEYGLASRIGKNSSTNGFAEDGRQIIQIGNVPKETI